MFEALRNTFQNKKVFVTGHTGFKGAWLTEMLTLLGAEVTGYSLKPDYNDSLYDILGHKDKCQSIIGDISDYETLAQSVIDANPDFIFHLAAQALVRRSYRETIDTFSSNVMGTVNILETLKSLSKKVTTVIITTDKVYENNEEGIPFKETDKLGGHDPYSSSKACCEIVVESYIKSFFGHDKVNVHQKAIASCRAGNVIGGGDWAQDRLVPDIIRSLITGKEILLRNPNAIRPWQHVIEPLSVYLLLAQKLEIDPIKFGTSWNIGPNLEDTRTVIEVAKTALSIWGEGRIEADNDKNAPHESGILKLNTDKLKNILNWAPRMSVNETIEKTMSWYKEFNSNKTNIEKFTQLQITDYFNL